MPFGSSREPWIETLECRGALASCHHPHGDYQEGATRQTNEKSAQNRDDVIYAKVAPSL